MRALSGCAAILLRHPFKSWKMQCERVQRDSAARQDHAVAVGPLSLKFGYVCVSCAFLILKSPPTFLLPALLLCVQFKTGHQKNPGIDAVCKHMRSRRCFALPSMRKLQDQSNQFQSILPSALDEFRSILTWFLLSVSRSSSFGPEY